MEKRQSFLQRKTKETDIDISLNLDGNRQISIDTGIKFLDHMLNQFAFHGHFDFTVRCQGDLDIDPHHSIEDIGISLGHCFRTIIAKPIGIKRYNTSYIPMDESLSRTVIDISGRSFHIFQGKFSTPLVGNFPTEMVEHFFYSFVSSACITLHQKILYGKNDHHKIEALFKGFGNCLHNATRVVGDSVSSTKGTF